MPLPKPPSKLGSLLKAGVTPAEPQGSAERPQARRAAVAASTPTVKPQHARPARAMAVSPAQPDQRPVAASASEAVVSVPAQKPPASRKSAKRTTAPVHAVAKLFVLDTNVLMHDPTSLFRFDEHDVYLPMITLEELDGHKKGMSEVARNARQASRELDALVAGVEGGIEL
ncbi:MAG: PhoH family protein, partial [Betaproteobacteria bacterium]|nr:PhoH family protein [Betaproteobacteria bacterium]